MQLMGSKQVTHQDKGATGPLGTALVGAGTQPRDETQLVGGP